MPKPPPLPEVSAGSPEGKGELGLPLSEQGALWIKWAMSVHFGFSCPLFPGSNSADWPSISSSERLLYPPVEWKQQGPGPEGLRELRQRVPPQNPEWVDDSRDLPSAWRLREVSVLPWPGVWTTGEGNLRHDWGWVSGLPCRRGDSKSKIIQENKKYEVFCTVEFED